MSLRFLGSIPFSTNDRKLTFPNRREQDFMNYVSLQDYRNAILLALSMDQPGRLFNLFSTLRPQRSSTSPQSITGSASVDQVIKTLSPINLARLLRHVKNWNANSKSYAVAQTVLHAILKYRPAKDLLSAFEGGNAVLAEIQVAKEDDEEGAAASVTSRERDMKALKELLDGLIPYTERHFARADKLVQDSYVVDYILSEMDSGLTFNGDAMDIDA